MKTEDLIAISAPMWRPLTAPDYRVFIKAVAAAIIVAGASC